MFDTLCDLVPRDTAYPERVRKLAILNRVLDGTFYDILPYHFHEERTNPGNIYRSDSAVRVSGIRSVVSL